ncbi:MAG: hypothetical protein V9G14_03755 [Cypionkella sp.]
MNDQHDNLDCDRSQFKAPVSWLMGRELLAGLKWIFAYTFMGNKLDCKDWMFAESISAPRSNNNASDPYWFDFIADTGDGMTAVYNIAYLCMSDLWVDNPSTVGADKVALQTDSVFTQHLPRGEFLFVGGDTAYHIADTASLKERFQTPFNCAALDIIRSGKTIDQRPLYGIPANHDYYDFLDGFNRQFCQPISHDSHNPLLNDPKDPQLGLLGFERLQKTSYISLDLPFNWCLWGLDCQTGKMDKRQRAFFVSTFYPQLLKTGILFDIDKKAEVEQKLMANAPSKLIVVTPEPTTVFGKWANPDSQVVETFKSLGLQTSFLADSHGKLNADRCRLDISGDIHHYERYWGNSQDDKTQSNYASVVAGGGGAFLHPSHTDLNEIASQALYPPKADSHQLFTKKILNPLNIFLGGYIWLAGAIVAFLSYFAVTIPYSTWSLFKLMPSQLRPELTGESLLSQMTKALDVTKTLNDYACCNSSYYFDLLYVVLFGLFLGYWLYKSPQHFEDSQKSAKPEDWHKGVLLFIAPIVVSFLPLLLFISWNRNDLAHPFLASVLIELFFIVSLLLFSLSRRYSDILIKRSKQHRETLFELMPLWVINVSAFIYTAFGIFRYGTYSTSVITFNLLITIVWILSTLGLIALAMFSGGLLFDKISEKFKFGLIGLWHSTLQIVVPVCLVLYTDWLTMLIITLLCYGVTLFAGQVFSRPNFSTPFNLKTQHKLAIQLALAWIALGLGVILVSAWGTPVAVTWTRIFAAFALGMVFSCIWFGWYLAVSLAFNGHNNEAGGGARSEQYRHMIRFKLEEHQLTGYVIGFDKPVNEISKDNPPKFRLIDVFTIRAK